MAAHNLSRQGDQDAAGGKIMKGAANVFVEGKPAGLHTSLITPHAPYTYPHLTSKTTEGSPNVYIENCPVLRIGSHTTCGHKIVSGAGNVFVP